jgi:SAM-dependent methyltransferase
MVTDANSGTVHRFESPNRVLGELLRGYSLTRSLLHLALERHELRGRVLDLGSKTTEATYYGYLRKAAGCEFTFSDLLPRPGVVAADIEQPLPFEAESFDTVLAFNLYEHVFRLDSAPREIFRVLRPNGRLLLSVPFLHEYHADPDDFHRLTDSALRRMHEQHGFRTQSVTAIGEGLLTLAGSKLPSLVLPPRVRPAAAAGMYLCATAFDRLLSLRPAVTGRSPATRFALAFLAVFEKPA